jgi:hypothetical protein
MNYMGIQIRKEVLLVLVFLFFVRKKVKEIKLNIINLLHKKKELKMN